MMKARAIAETMLPILMTALISSVDASDETGSGAGLGEIMSAQQMRHAKLWFAGRARNWKLAAYEVDELEEGFGDVVRLHPTHKDAPAPLSELVPAMMSGPIEALRGAVAAEDGTQFQQAFDALTRACNACHQATHFGFNVVITPTTNPYSNQRFEPAR